mgnify:CR=1 FL=1
MQGFYFVKLKKFIKSLKTVEKVQILPYHSMGKFKWEKLQSKYELEEVRDAYIDRYISNNAKMGTMLCNYLDGVKYTFLTELLLIFTKVTEDTKRYENVCNAVGNKGNIALIESAVETFVNEMQTDKYADEMTDALESL